MSSDPKYILEVIPSGSGSALDLGGGRGMLREPLRAKGYRYLNLDLQPHGNGEPSVVGNAHLLPFRDASFDLVVSKDTLEHFLDPWTVIKEVHRVLKSGGRFVIWVPFMHPFHSNDFYRYSPLALRHLLADFNISRFDSPLWLFSVAGLVGSQILKRLHLGFLESRVKWLCSRCDRLFMLNKKGPASFAMAYRLVAEKS